MKKLITSIMLMFVFMSISSAQSVPMAGSGDSLSNTETKTCTYRVNGTPTAVTIQYVLTKASGTVAGKTHLYASLDGVTYIAIDSITATNVAVNSKMFIISNPKNYVFYKTSHTGSGTMKVYISANILARKD